MGVYLSKIPKSETDIMSKLNEIESALKIQLAKIEDIKLSLLNPLSIEEKMPTGIINPDLAHRVIEVDPDEGLITDDFLGGYQHLGKNMNEEY